MCAPEHNTRAGGSLLSNTEKQKWQHRTPACPSMSATRDQVHFPHRASEEKQMDMVLNDLVAYCVWSYVTFAPWGQEVLLLTLHMPE